MKKLLILPILILYGIVCHSQGFVSEANQWNVMIYDYYYGYNTEVFKIEEDSLFNSMAYKKVWWSHDTAMATWTFQGLLREESNIVYYVPPEGSEGVLYDFNLDTGDTCWIKNMWCGDTEVQVIINDIDTVQYYGVERKRWYIDNPMNGLVEYWIEGIGSTFGPLYSKYYKCITCPTWDLLCYHEYNSVLYMMPGMDTCYIYSVGTNEIIMADQIKIFPNPSRNKFEVRSAEFGIDKIELFDIMGRKVFEQNLSNNSNEFDIDISLLNAGIYYCRLKIGASTVTKKIIKN